MINRDAHHHWHRTGMTLIEVITAVVLAATLMASVVVIIRSSYTLWQTQESDLESNENACAVFRHFLRNARQATSVVSISGAGDNSGSLSLVVDLGDTEETRLWDHDSGTDQVFYGVSPGTADQLLAEDIAEVEFIGYQQDGVTPTSTLAEIQLIQCRIKFTYANGDSRDFSRYAWLRSW